jgi:hypothetical protein
VRLAPSRNSDSDSDSDNGSFDALSPTDQIEFVLDHHVSRQNVAACVAHCGWR